MPEPLFQADQSIAKLFEVVAQLDNSIKQQFIEFRQSISQAPMTTVSTIPETGEATELAAKNKRLEDEVKQLEQTLAQTTEIARRSIAENQAKASKLHKIIINSGLEDAGPIDEEVERVFSALSHGLFSFVKKHCTNENGKKWYSRLPSDAKNWYVVKIMASRIWRELFDPERLYFGFLSQSLNKDLARVEESLQYSKIPLSELVDWRVRTCQLSKHLNPDTCMDDRLCAELVVEMCERLGPFWHYGNVELKKRMTEIKHSLTELYQQAYIAVMLIRRAKIEYRWVQLDRDKIRSQPLTDDEFEVMASTGVYTRREDGGKDIVTVFGEVIKADGPSGRVSESWQLLRKCSVMLGTLETNVR